jgi:hypothetical protein
VIVDDVRVQVISAARPEWIAPFTGLQPAQFRKLVRLVAQRGGETIADGRPGRTPSRRGRPAGGAGRRAGGRRRGLARIAEAERDMVAAIEDTRAAQDRADRDRRSALDEREKAPRDKQTAEAAARAARTDADRQIQDAWTRVTAAERCRWAGPGYAGSGRSRSPRLRSWSGRRDGSRSWSWSGTASRGHGGVGL